MRTLAVLILLGSRAACSHHAANPMWPVTVPVGVAVLVEDHLEDPACDAVQTSILEAVDDVLGAPWNVLWQVVAYEGALWWGLGDAVAGNPPAFPAKFE